MRTSGRMRRLAGPLLGGLLPSYAALLSAEYVSSSPVALLVGFNVLAYVPYYIVLLAVIGRAGPLSVRSLYLFGAVLGLGTESFITKVAWAHPAGWHRCWGRRAASARGNWRCWCSPTIRCCRYWSRSCCAGMPSPCPGDGRWRRGPGGCCSGPSFTWRGYLTYLAGFAVVSWACYLLLTLSGGTGRVVVALLALAGGIAGTGYLLACVALALLPGSPSRPDTAGGRP